MTYPINGGKGKKFAPGTTHVRVPAPLKPLVGELAQKYREVYGTPEDPEAEALIDRVVAAMGGAGCKGTKPAATKPALTTEVPAGVEELLNFLAATLKAIAKDGDPRNPHPGKKRKMPDRLTDLVKEIEKWQASR